MPIEIAAVNQQIEEMADAEQIVARDRPQICRQALELLQYWSDKPDQLLDLIMKITQRDTGIRSAYPGLEKINITIPCPSEFTPPGMVLAGDGSQITPNPDSEPIFGLLNLGTMCCPPDGSQTSIHYHTLLLHHNDLITPDGSLMSEGVFRLRRDIEERAFLIDIALASDAPALALMDGTLLPYQQPGSTAKSDQHYDNFLSKLQQYTAQGGYCAGYIDKPRSKLLVQMLELSTASHNPGNLLRGFRHFRQIKDRDLMANILGPGERSAVFPITSISIDMPDHLKVCFFYLNVSSRIEKACIARVEIPAWVAASPDLLQTLHGILIRQCRHTGNKPYPYVLIRAHEISVIHRDVAQQIKMMIATSLRRRGIEMEESIKAQLKAISL